jgi:hypothetical protein
MVAWSNHFVCNGCQQHLLDDNSHCQPCLGTGRVLKGAVLAGRLSAHGNSIDINYLARLINTLLTIMLGLLPRFGGAEAQ